MNIQEMLQQAMHHHQSRRFADAEELCLHILRIDPMHLAALNLLGVLALQEGRPPRARQLFQRAVELSPANAEYHFNLGMAQAADKMPAEAEASFRQAALLAPRNPAAWIRFADSLMGAGKLEETAAACRKALSLKPELPETQNMLGRALFSLGDLSGAIAAFRRAAELSPRYPDAHCNLGRALFESGNYQAGIGPLRQAIALKSEFPVAQWNLSLLMLRLGNFDEGWLNFESRWRLPIKDMVMPYTQPWWDGTELHGKRIILHAEQGFGDTIQFVRYVPMVLERGGKVSVVAQRELVPLLRGMVGAGAVEQWLSAGDALPDYDLHCPLLSLPGRFHTQVTNIPTTVPYLKSDPSRAAEWRERLAKHPRPWIGLAWTGSALNPGHRRRAFQLKEMAPLGTATSGSFFSLQKGEAAAQARTAPMPLVDWTDELHDFADTAALMDGLDLVITSDTSVAHLAGAMGKPVWIMLPFVPDWRWLVERSDSPWYPTARLFRQQRLGDWSPPMRDVADALRTMAENKAPA